MIMKNAPEEYADDKWRFSYWNIDGARPSQDCLHMHACHIIMDGNKKLEINFTTDSRRARDEYDFYSINVGAWLHHNDPYSYYNTPYEAPKTFINVKYDSYAHLEANCSPNCTVNGRFNSHPIFQANPPEGWSFVEWYGDCHGNSITCTAQLDSDITVYALFVPIDKIDESGKIGNGCQARDFSAMEERVQDAYIALYGRPADVEGLEYWSTKLQAAGGDIHAILDAFIDPDTEEYRRRFSGKDDAELLEILYQHLFNREIDPDGFLAYLSDMFQGTFKLTSTAIKVVDGVSHDSSDWAELEARRKLARHYVTIMEATPGGDTDVLLESYQKMLHGMENVDSVCNALSQAVFPAAH